MISTILIGGKTVGGEYAVAIHAHSPHNVTQQHSRLELRVDAGLLGVRRRLNGEDWGREQSHVVGEKLDWMGVCIVRSWL